MLSTRPSTDTRRPAPLRTALVYLLAASLLPLTVGAAVFLTRPRPLDPPPELVEPLPDPPRHHPDRRTAVIVTGVTGAESIDLLAPYEVLATSGAFNVYTLGPERRPLPLFPASPGLQGVHLVPHYAFDEFDRRFDAPDLVVVPWVPSAESAANAPLRDWLAERDRSETILLTICGGSWTAAQAGLLDDREATTHHNVFGRVERDHPEVNWVRGRRWVDDGEVISSAGITAGIDATLHTVSRMVSREAAEAVARELGYRHLDFLDDPTFSVPSPNTALRSLYRAYRWPTSDIGLVLYDGVGEMEVASVVDLHPRTYTNVVRPLSIEPGVVQTRNGLHLIARHHLADAPAVDRVLLPGTPLPHSHEILARWAEDRDVDLERVRLTDDAFPFDSALRDVAAHDSVAIAAQVAGGIEYPTDETQLAGRRWPHHIAAHPLLLALAGLAVAAAIRSRRA